MKRSKVYYGALTFFTMILLIHVPSWADSYFRDVVNQAIEKQVEQRREEIEAEVKKNIQDALKDEQTQAEVQALLQKAVAAELEVNGEEHLRRVIRNRAPHAMPFLFPNDISGAKTETQ